MPVIINEIEVLEPPPAAQASADNSAPRPTPPLIPADAVLRLLRDADGRQRRLVAD